MYDLVIRGGRIGTAEAVFEADIGISHGRIAAIGGGLVQGKSEIDAQGKFVLPGGVDSHCHIEQMSAAGIMTADDFESATTSAIFGGTTTVISFAAQQRGMDIEAVVADYARRAERGALIDYSFHMIVSDPNPDTLGKLPDLIAAGHNSIKVFMTYDRIKLDDEQILALMALARQCGAMLCVHAENHAMIAFAGQQLLDAGKTAPRFQAQSHPRASEAEAFQRLIALSNLVGQPVTIFHVSTAEGAQVVAEARRNGTLVTAETCPHYLLLTEAELDRPGIEAGKWCCSPPLRTKSDQQALWAALRRRDIGILSSDHAPYAWDETGKLKHGPDASFKQIANGLPGLELRQILLFDAALRGEHLSIPDFVDLTATTPARHYGLADKGSFAIGADADIVVWDPEREMTITAADLHDRTLYTPYEGRKVRGLPTVVIGRGDVLMRDGELLASPGHGRHVPRFAETNR